MSDYNAQAEKFLNDNGITFRATLSDTKPAPWTSEPGSHPADELQGHHYRVTLSKAKYEGSYDIRRPKPKRLVFDFWGSITDAKAGKTDLRPYDVLACLSSDVNTPETFKDFCGEYGYDTDSIKAKQLFNRCYNFSKRLQAFFTAQEIEQLQEIR